MSVGGSRMRAKLLAGIMVLWALWAVAAFATGGEAVDLFRARALGDHLGQPTDSVILALQEERRLTTALLGGADRSAALTAQRTTTDAAFQALRRDFSGGWTRWAAGDQASQRADQLLERLTQVPDIRAAVDNGRLDRARAAAAYTETIDAAFRVYATPRLWDDPRLASGGNALVALSRARELLAREDALVRGALVAGALGDDERRTLAQLVGAQRLLRADAEATLPAADLARYRDLVEPTRLIALTEVEDRLIQPPPADGTAGTVGTQVWADATEAVLAGLREVVLVGARKAISAATPGAVGTIVWAGLVCGLGLVAVGALSVAGLRAARALARVPADEDAGLLDAATGQTAADQPVPGRPRQLAVLLADLNRRNQSLLHRQLRVLDAMERRESDDEDLGDLFRADHLATRIRRNVEKAITLAGGTPGRRWRRPVSIVDVIRAAGSEVAEYPRVATSQIEPTGLAGEAVADVTHLLAELIENATAYSPGHTRVRVSGQHREDGYVVTVSDAGPGMSEEDLATAHEVLSSATPPDGGAWWGLYSAGRFAERHGIAVTLHGSANGGLAAEVLIPAVLINDPAQPARDADTAVLEAIGAAGETTVSGLPTRVRNATVPASPARSGRPRSGRQIDRVARMRGRVEAAAETMELPVTPAAGELSGQDRTDADRPRRAGS